MSRAFLAAGLAFLAAGFAGEQLREQRATFPRDTDVLYLPPPAHLERMALGYREALADFIWIRAVVFAGEHVKDRSFDWVENYLEAIFTLAPTFRRPYAWGGVVAIYAGADPDRPAVDAAIRTYRRGLEQFPEDHELLFALGMLLTRDVQTLPDYELREREQARFDGVEALRRSAAFGGSPLVRQVAATLVDEGTSDALEIQFLESQLLITEDDHHRRLLRRKLARVLGDTGVARLERVEEDFRSEWHRDFPYLPESLYAVIRRDLIRREPTSSP